MPQSCLKAFILRLKTISSKSSNYFGIIRIIQERQRHLELMKSLVHNDILKSAR